MNFWIRFLRETNRSPSRIDFLFMLSDRGLRLFFGMFMAVLLARHLGAEAFGWLNYGIVILSLATVVAQLGLDIIVVRNAAQAPEGADGILGAAFCLRMIAGLAIAMGLWILVPWLGSTTSEERRLIGILAWGALAPAFGVPTLWFQAKTRSHVVIKSGFLVLAAITILRLLFVLLDAGVTEFAWLIVLESAGTCVVGWVQMRKNRGRPDFHALWVYTRPLLAAGWPLMVGAFASGLYMKMDFILLRWFYGAETIGVYAVATRLSETAYGVPALLATSVMASLSAVIFDDVRFAEKATRYFRVSAALGYAMALPVFVLGPWLIPLLFGQEYIEAGEIARIHILSVVFLSLTLARGRVLVVQGREIFTMVSALLGCIFSLGVNAALIPLWGAKGAALATVVSHAFAGIGITLIYRPTRAIGRQLLGALLRPDWWRHS